MRCQRPDAACANLSFEHAAAAVLDASQRGRHVSGPAAKLERAIARRVAADADGINLFDAAGRCSEVAVISRGLALYHPLGVAVRCKCLSKCVVGTAVIAGGGRQDHKFDLALDEIAGGKGGKLKGGA
jgi:hypothetical protein